MRNLRIGKKLFGHINSNILNFNRISDALDRDKDDGCLDFGCVAAHGYFNLNRKSGHYEINANGKAATGFLFKLIAELQFSGTVPMIDVEAYAQWLMDNEDKQIVNG